MTTKEEYETAMNGYMRQLKSLKGCIKIKAVLMSDDNGKTWFIYRQNYVSHADGEYENFDFAQVNLEGLPLKTDSKWYKQLIE